MKLKFSKSYVLTTVIAGAIFGVGAAFASLLPEHAPAVQKAKEETVIQYVGEFGLVDYNKDKQIDVIVDKPSDTYRVLAVAPEFTDAAKNDFLYNPLEVISISEKFREELNGISGAVKNLATELDFRLAMEYALQRETKEK